MSQPFRLQAFRDRVPRALPWAENSQPFGLKNGTPPHRASTKSVVCVGPPRAAHGSTATYAPIPCSCRSRRVGLLVLRRGLVARLRVGTPRPDGREWLAVRLDERLAGLRGEQQLLGVV